eukprot:SM014204S00573  [mRNA]  locus=s14204:44:304:- [translate_table: standard]
MAPGEPQPLLPLARASGVAEPRASCWPRRARCTGRLVDRQSLCRTERRADVKVLRPVSARRQLPTPGAGTATRPR